MRTRRAAVPILALLSCAAAAGAEIVLLQNGERREGQISITYEKGLLFREKETSPGRYYPYGEVSRIITSDGMLYYLMPRGNEPTEKKRDGFFPLARVLLPRRKKAAPIPRIELPKGVPVRVSCAGARDAATIELAGGGAVRLLGVAPFPEPSGDTGGDRAARWLFDRVKGRVISLFPGPQGSEDRGTPQAYVVLDGALLNAEMIERGWARASETPAPHPYREAFESLERFARNLQRGLWGAETS